VWPGCGHTHARTGESEGEGPHEGMGAHAHMGEGGVRGCVAMRAQGNRWEGWFQDADKDEWNAGGEEWR
jgi:hypothetical protein